MINKSVYIIILNYNHFEELTETVLSFKNQNYPNLHIVISDNGSTDRSLERIRQNYNDIHILENKANLGWSGGNNVGILYALSQKADYIGLANNDLFIDNQSLISTLVDNFEILKHQNIGLLGAKVNYYHNRLKTNNTGWILYPKNNKEGSAFNPFRLKTNITLPKNFTIPDSIDGSFMLAESNVFRTVGLFNESLFMYADEIEFSLRAWSKNIISAVNKDLTIYHKVGTSSIPNSPFSIYYRSRNLLYLTKHFNFSFRYILLYIKGTLKQLFQIIFKIPISPSKKLELIKSVFKGVFDGMLNKMGKRYEPQK